MTGEQALSCSSRNSFLFYSQRQVLNNVQPQIPTLVIFSSRWGHKAQHCLAWQPRGRLTAPPTRGFRSSHPGRFATNHKTSPLPQEDTEKATRLLNVSLISKNFSCKPYVCEILVPSIWLQLSVSPHIPSAVSQGCVWGDTADLRILTHSPFLNVTVSCTVGCKLGCVLKTANFYP